MAGSITGGKSLYEEVRDCLTLDLSNYEHDYSNKVGVR